MTTKCALAFKRILFYDRCEKWTFENVTDIVKLGYNDHGINEFTFITSKILYCSILGPKWQVTIRILSKL